MSCKHAGISTAEPLETIAKSEKVFKRLAKKIIQDQKTCNTCDFFVILK